MSKKNKVVKATVEVILVETDFKPITFEGAPFVKGWESTLPPEKKIRKTRKKEKSIFELIYKKTRDIVL